MKRNLKWQIMHTTGCKKVCFCKKVLGFKEISLRTGFICVKRFWALSTDLFSANMLQIKRKISKDGVLTVTLNRPESLNSLNYELVMGVISAFDEANSNDDIRSVILTGEGRGFCSGADLTGGGWPNEPEWSAGESAANSMIIGICIK